MNNTNNNNDNMDKYLNELKAEDHSGTFNETEAWIRDTGAILKRKKERKFLYMKKFIFANKLKFAYIFLLGALMFAACTMPVTQEQTLGHALSWTVDANDKEAVAQIEKLPWIDQDQLTVELTNENGKDVVNYKMVAKETDMAKIEGYKKQLEDIRAVTKVGIFPLNEKVTRPMYAAALNSFFRIDVDASNKSDAEVEQEVERQLKEAGFNITTINFGKDENGMRTFNMKLEKAGQDEGKGFEIRVKDGNGNTQNEMVIKNKNGAMDQDKLKNMTDKEIRDMIRKDMNDPNIPDSEIIIERKNGDVTIMLERAETTGSGDQIMKRKMELKTK